MEPTGFAETGRPGVAYHRPHPLRDLLARVCPNVPARMATYSSLDAIPAFVLHIHFTTGPTGRLLSISFYRCRQAWLHTGIVEHIKDDRCFSFCFRCVCCGYKNHTS